MAQDRFDADLNIIANSDIEFQVDPLTKDLVIIQKLADEPNDQDGLTAAQLKAKFDEAGLTIQKYINETLIQQVNGTIATEAKRVANENQRQAHEAGRQSAEAERVTAETNRGSAETGRQSAETARGTAEAGRVNAENGRVSAENARGSAENGRASAESARRTAETGRAHAENGRVSAENGRVSAENGRAAAENARAQAETARENAQTAFFQGVSAEARTLEPGSGATAEAVPAGGSFQIKIGVPQGVPGVTAGGVFGFYVDDGGDLILTYAGDTVPPFHISEAGDLIYTFSEEGV